MTQKHRQRDACRRMQTIRLCNCGRLRHRDGIGAAQDWPGCMPCDGPLISLTRMAIYGDICMYIHVNAVSAVISSLHTGGQGHMKEDSKQCKSKYIHLQEKQHKKHIRPAQRACWPLSPPPPLRPVLCISLTFSWPHFFLVAICLHVPPAGKWRRSNTRTSVKRFDHKLSYPLGRYA